MTSYRFHFRPPRGGGRGMGRLFIRVIHQRRYRDIPCGYEVLQDEWEPVSRTVKLPDGAGGRRYELTEIRKCMRRDLRKLEGIVGSLSASGEEYTVKDICSGFRQAGRSDTLTAYSATLSRELVSNGQLRTARAYRSAAGSITRYTGRDIGLAEITPALIRSYEHYLLDRGLKMNTVSFYMRNLRAIWYRAVKAGIVAGQSTNPFVDVFTGVFETRRRALDQQELSMLVALDKQLGCDGVGCMSDAGVCGSSYGGSSRPGHAVAGGGHPVPGGACERGRRAVGAALPGAYPKALRDALNYFMFAFHSRGMSFVDLAYLKKSEVNGDTILYKRKKTGFFIEVKVTKPMRRIINHFKSDTKGSQYVFPIIHERRGTERRQYETGLNRQNRMLKELASMAGISKTLSTHVARHSWATLAKRMGYSIPLISEGLGHRDTKVTATYLASFERSAMDELSTRISRAVKAA